LCHKPQLDTFIGFDTSPVCGWRTDILRTVYRANLSSRA